MADLVRTHHHRGKDLREKADTPACVHVRHTTIEGYTTLIIKVTDVVVIALFVMASLQELVLERMWIGFGQERTLWWIPFHELVSQIGSQKCQGVHICHAFAGCDLVSAFRGKGGGGGSQRCTPLDRLLRSVFYLHHTRGSWWSRIDRSGEATNVYILLSCTCFFASRDHTMSSIQQRGCSRL